MCDGLRTRRGQEFLNGGKLKLPTITLMYKGTMPLKKLSNKVEGFKGSHGDNVLAECSRLVDTVEAAEDRASLLIELST